MYIFVWYKIFTYILDRISFISTSVVVESLSMKHWTVFLVEHKEHIWEAKCTYILPTL